jgi:alkanesulfonate monooxygenase SsuD/methylene tetrahydromethanopterin reductase-like flavin-dependent oxidoreductase (luciferase family)
VVDESVLADEVGVYCIGLGEHHYHRAFAQFGRPTREIGVHSHGYVADTDDKAREELWPDYKKMRDRIGSERGWPSFTPEQFRVEIERGSLYVGAPETVARRFATTAKALGLSRFHMKYSAGTLSHEKIMRCIELYRRKVIPLTRDMLA